MSEYPVEFDPAFHDDLKVLLETRNENLIRSLLATLHPADLADVLEHLDEESRSYVFGLLPDKESSQTLVEMEEGARESVLQDLAASEIADLVEEMDSDDAVDLVRDLPDDVAQEVLTDLSPDDARNVRRLLEYDEETAGGIMATELVKVPESGRIQDAIDRIRVAGEELGDIPHIFVVDSEGRLSGYLSLRDILLTSPTAPVSDIVNRDVRSVPAELDQEEVAEVVRKYDLAVVPVVDNQGLPIGIITHDDILDVYEEEASEDIARLSGSLGEESPADSIFDVTRNRLPWLFLGLVGGTLAAFVISYFTKSLKEALQISFFIPVIAAMGGNVGMQSSAVIVRGLATGEIHQANTRMRLIKEIIVGCINALLLSLVLWAVVFFWLDDFSFGLAVGISLAAAMIIAAFIGSSVPIALRRIGIDPALATGPFVTTTNDILALTIYLILTTVLLKYF
jgi:magnesium transporter